MTRGSARTVPGQCRAVPGEPGCGGRQHTVRVTSATPPSGPPAPEPVGAGPDGAAQHQPPYGAPDGAAQQPPGYGGPGGPAWPASPYGSPTPAGPSALRRHGLGDLAAAGLTTLGLVLLAAPVGLLWAWLAPHVDVQLAAGGADIADPETKDFISADGHFLILGLVVGALCGVTAYLLGRRHGPGVVIALALGGLLAAWVAARTGMTVGRSSFRSALDAGGGSGIIQVNVRLRASAALFGWPVAALVSFLFAAMRRPERD